MRPPFVSSFVALSLVIPAHLFALEGRELASPAEEQQLPRAMHSAMKELPLITVGPVDADIVGSDNRALQAAVDFIAGLGGGVVQIKPGEFVMHDSLHLRSLVTVRG